MERRGPIQETTVKSTRFVTACFIMSFIAYHRKDKLSTPTIARWVETNPSRVRQIVASLVRAGLVVSKVGNSGGVAIARNPKLISLKDIYEAVAEQEAVLFSVENPFSAWKDRCNVYEVLTKFRGELSLDFQKKLSKIMLSDLYKHQDDAVSELYMEGNLKSARTRKRRAAG
jgi:Rrf2 family protein